MSRVLRRVLAGAASVALLIIGVQFVGLTNASAHDNSVTGVSACQADGTYTVTWTSQNGNWGHEVATVKSSSPTAASVLPHSQPIDNEASAPFVETGVPGASTRAALYVTGLWQDGYTTSNGLSMPLPGTCLPGKTPVAPTAANGGCLDYAVTQPTITIHPDSGVAYSIDGTPRSAGAYVVSAGPHVVTASSSTYLLSQVTWDFGLTEVQGDCLTAVTPASPTVTQSVCQGNTDTVSSLTVPADTAGIEYTVAGPTSGWTAANAPVVTATLSRGYEWPSGALPGAWVMTSPTTATYSAPFQAAPDCRATTMPVSPTVVQSVCAASGTTPVAPSITAPADSAEIVYTVSSAPASGWAAGDSPVVTATAQPGYKLATALPDGWTPVSGSDTVATWSTPFAAAPSCVVPAVPTVSQSACSATSSGTTPPTVTLATTPGVVYTISVPGPYTAGEQGVTVTATPMSGYAFDTGQVPGWTLANDGTATSPVVFTAAPTCAHPASPTFGAAQCANYSPTAATYTIPNVAGVSYYVNSVLTSPTTYTAKPGSTIAVTAEPQAGYTLVGPTSWTNTFGSTPTCTKIQQPANAAFTAAQCVSGTLKPGTYTVPASVTVDYWVNGTLTTAGTYHAASGMTATVTATAKPGYTLTGSTRWSFDFAEKGCTGVDSESASRAPSPTPTSSAKSAHPSHGVDNVTASRAPSGSPLAGTGVASQSLLTTGLDLLVGGAALMLLGSLARRRRGAGPRH